MAFTFSAVRLLKSSPRLKIEKQNKPKKDGMGEGRRREFPNMPQICLFHKCTKSICLYKPDPCAMKG